MPGFPSEFNDSNRSAKYLLLVCFEAQPTVAPRPGKLIFYILSWILCLWFYFILVDQTPGEQLQLHCQVMFNVVNTQWSRILQK